MLSYVILCYLMLCYVMLCYVMLSYLIFSIFSYLIWSYRLLSDLIMIMIWSDLIWSDLIWSDLIWSDLIWSDLIWSDLIWSYLWSCLVFDLSCFMLDLTSSCLVVAMGTGEHPPNQDHDPEVRAEWNKLSQDEKVRCCWNVQQCAPPRAVFLLAAPTVSHPPNRV